METQKTFDILKMAIFLEKRGFAFKSRFAWHLPDPAWMRKMQG